MYYAIKVCILVTSILCRMKMILFYTAFLYAVQCLKLLIIYLAAYL